MFKQPHHGQGGRGGHFPRHQQTRTYRRKQPAAQEAPPQAAASGSPRAHSRANASDLPFAKEPTASEAVPKKSQGSAALEAPGKRCAKRPPSTAAENEGSSECDFNE